MTKTYTLLNSPGADITLLMCTRNRASQISKFLSALQKAIDSAIELNIEVIIVDNGSSDNTLSILNSWAKSQETVCIKILTETRPGLSRARNCEIKSATGSIICLTDDDCYISEKFFLNVFDSFGENFHQIIGGQIKLGDPLDLPITVVSRTSSSVLEANKLPCGYIMGANMAFGRHIFYQVGGFDERFGAGAEFVAAEDSDFMVRAMQQRIKVGYDPNFFVEHFHGRRNQQSADALYDGYDFGNGALFAKHFCYDRRIIRAILRQSVFALLEILGLDRFLKTSTRGHLVRLKNQCLGFIHFVKTNNH